MMLFLFAVTLFSSYYLEVYSEYHHGYGQQQQLQTVPEIEAYGKLEYPHFDIIDLGSFQKDDLPPKTIHLTKKIVITEPKPYPVKVPHPVPYPVPHEVPYPVVHKELVKVPEPVPYPVTKTVGIPVEVPKPYPVPVHEFKESGGGQTGYGGDQNSIEQGNSYGQFTHNSGDQQDYGNQNSYGKPANVYGVPNQEPGQPLGSAEYQNQGHDYQVDHQEGYSDYSEEPQHDQSVNYAVLLQNQNNGGQNLHQENQQTDNH